MDCELPALRFFLPIGAEITSGHKTIAFIRQPTVRPHSGEMVNWSQRAGEGFWPVVALLGVTQFGAIAVGVRRLDHGHRRLKSKVQDRL
jgi:hypothetical protein